MKTDYTDIVQGMKPWQVVNLYWSHKSLLGLLEGLMGNPEEMQKQGIEFESLIQPHARHCLIMRACIEVLGFAPGYEVPF